jgi:uncharacterized protein (DUF1800 family)
MRRAAFGAKPNEIQQKLSQGLEATVDELVNYDQVEEDPSVPVAPTTPQGSSDITLLNIDDIATWWLNLMIRTKRPLRERMVLFWHDHYATSFEKVNQPNGPKHLYWQNQLERQFAVGNFRELSKGMNRDAAMLRWLDTITSRRTSPNENYGRELFEIFMLGLVAFEAGAYTEPDVQQAARAFTGWGWNLLRLDAPTGNQINGPATDPALVVPIPPNVNDNSAAAREHDYTNKTVFGVVQNFNGDDIIDLVLDHEPQRAYVARMLGEKLFEHFAYEDPEEYIVDHMAAVLLRTNFNIKAALRDLFLNVKEFYSEKALHSLIKWPGYYMVSSLRLLGLNSINARNANNSLRAMGQWLFWPPDVFGWPGREDWITTSQTFARANWANGICASLTSLPNANIDALRTLGGLGDTATPDQVVDYFVSLLIQRPLAPNVRQSLVEYLRKNNAGTIGNFSIVTDRSANYTKLRGLIHLFLARPEFQNY